MYLVTITPVDYSPQLKQLTRLEIEIHLRNAYRKKHGQAKRFRFKWVGNVVSVSFVTPNKLAVEVQTVEEQKRAAYGNELEPIKRIG